MVVLDATIVNIALPHAQAALGFSNNDRQWIVTGYSLAFGSAAARRADRRPVRPQADLHHRGHRVRRRLGVRRRRAELRHAAHRPRRPGRVRRAARPGHPLAAHHHLQNPVERTKAMGIYGGIAGAGASVGLLLGGVLTEYLDWRYVMYVNVLIAAVALVGGVALLTRLSCPSGPSLTWWARCWPASACSPSSTGSPTPPCRPEAAAGPSRHARSG